MFFQFVFESLTLVGAFLGVEIIVRTMEECTSKKIGSDLQNFEDILYQCWDK